VRIQTTDVLFVVGAGASVPAGIPPYRRWKDHAKEQAQSANLRDLWGIWRAGFPRHDIEELVDGLRLSKELGWVPQDTHLGKRFRQPYDDTHYKSQPLRAIPYDRVERQIRQFIIAQLCRAKPGGYYDSLASQLVELCSVCDQRVTVLSLNWDTLLEDALIRSGAGYRHLGTGDYVGESIGKYEIQLVKPHGSLGVGLSSTGVFSYHSMYEWHGGEGPGVSPLFALPGTSKRDELDGMTAEYAKHSWEAVATTLNHAGAIVSVGYSWTGTDRELLLFAKHRYAPPASMAFYNGPDAAAVMRGCAALGIPEHDSSTVDARAGIEELVAFGVQRRAMTLLLASGHKAIKTPRAEDWILRNSLVVNREDTPSQWTWTDLEREAQAKREARSAKRKARSAHRSRFR